MKKYLEKLIKTKEKRAEELKEEIKQAETAEKVRALGETLDEVLKELQEAKEQLNQIDNNTSSSEENISSEERFVIPDNAQYRGGHPIATYSQKAPIETRDNEDMLSTMEYRQAFAEYVRTGKTEQFSQLTKRTDETLETGDIGKIIPNTVMKELVKELKSYGQLYNRVRKLNVRGGVEFPIEDLIPTVSWITETTISDTQKAPELKNSVSFGYHIAEARIAQTLLASIVSLDLLESEIAKLLAEAFIKEFDRIIVNGSGNGQPTGILNDSRVSANNKIKIKEEEAVDWTKWREKLFSKIPLAYRGGGVCIMTVDTWESLICTMKDTNNRPLYSETFDVVTGETILRFNGKEVILIESDLGLHDYSTATTGQAYMIYIKPETYAINSNLQIGFKRYFNDDTNKWINKGLCIMDGKLLDTKGTFIVSK